MELGNDHIQRIHEKITSVKLVNKTLAVDLLDHICCMIEDRVANGASIEEAEQLVLYEMGGGKLKAIDFETTLLTQNKITMKKRTKIIGWVALGLLVAGFIFKSLHLLGAGVLWGLGVLTATFGFAFFLFLDRFSYEKSRALKISSVIGYLGAASVLLGFGLKLLHWPIASAMIAAGGFTLLIYFVLNSAFLGQSQQQINH